MPKSISLFLTMVALVACSGESAVDAPPAGGDQPAGGQPTPVEAPELQLELGTLLEKAQTNALVPSPAEMQKALNAAGIDTQLAQMVPDRSGLKMNVPNTDQAAVRTGVVLADLLLTLSTAPKEKMVANLNQIKAGMAQLGGGDEIPAIIDDLSAQIQNDAISRDDLVKELDELSGVLIPEIEYKAGEQVVPLIQAGSWLEGANLIASAMEASGKYDGADNLLKQPAVVEYFQKYVATEGASKAPSDVIDQLKGTLDTLGEICAKEHLEEADVKTIKSSTASVLDLL